jgi:hypothetical protein
MNKYSPDFQELINLSLNNSFYIGLGNPNAKILIVGKESGFDPEDTLAISKYLANATDWLTANHEYLKPFTPEEKSHKNNNHTWQKYQRLHDLIIGVPPKKNYFIDFVTNVFTTELSDLPNTNSTLAKRNKLFKEKIIQRKKLFFQSEFIRKFPIVVIAALDSNYISNVGTGDSREIDNIFEVEFSKLIESNNGKDKIWLHSSTINNKPKIVIHTRQLTNGASINLQEMISREIRTFITENNIEVILPEYPNK